MSMMSTTKRKIRYRGREEWAYVWPREDGRLDARLPMARNGRSYWITTIISEADVIA